MKARPTQSRKGVKGQLPLAGSRDSVPCGVWGNAPTVPRATSISNALNKGAGSEASLPVTLRVRRRAPKLLFPQDSMKNHFVSFIRQLLRKSTLTFPPLRVTRTPISACCVCTICAPALDSTRSTLFAGDDFTAIQAYQKTPKRSIAACGVRRHKLTKNGRKGFSFNRRCSRIIRVCGCLESYGRRKHILALFL